MRILAFYGSIVFVLGFSITACSNQSNGIEGTWKMNVSGMDAGQMIVTPDSLSVYPSTTSTLMGGKPSSEKFKLKRSGNQITVIGEKSGTMTFTVLDRDH